ncbi:hypothetical protein K470DRAFT_270394 [Piedraia hortae CBS 480.64]|uniref:Fucose-specific lectin n=1 Tax=Piedraia hortae CBS 480.64 TaxID=1314780 RepID=A0A6A7BZS0_9PEZI|nr:hypothetical protein K470DRAFT_270394 [Piedraia hortae CBS 480.64]
MSGTSMYATTSLSSDGTTWNLFYIDTDAYAAQLNLKDDTIVFNRHLENNKPGDASNARFTSMLACPFYYSSTNNTNGPIDRTGTLVYYSTNTTSINEYIYKDGWWKYLKNWPNINAQAGMGCFTQANSSIAQLYIYNQVQEVEFWWKDMSHDAEWWHKCEFTIKLDPDEVFLGNDENWFYTKNDNNMVVARDVQQVYNCNSTTAVQEPVLVGNRAALNMTDLTAGQVQGTNGERARFVFYQDTKGNVTGYGRPQNGKWEGGKDVLFC